MEKQKLRISVNRMIKGEVGTHVTITIARLYKYVYV